MAKTDDRNARAPAEIQGGPNEYIRITEFDEIDTALLQCAAHAYPSNGQSVTVGER